MVMPSNKVIINIDDQEIELKGQELTDFLAQREAENQETLARQNAAIVEREAKVAARLAVIERLGLSELEASLLIPEIAPLYFQV
jgi:sulfur carrier protein ThiS